MGLLQNGKWVDHWYDTKSTGVHFKRADAQFRNWITADGAPGPSGVGGFKAEVGRYHLYISHACPWAHRTMIFRALKRLDGMISVSVVNWHMAADGWTFLPGDGVVADPIHKATFLHQIHTAANPDFSARVTVPILWDKQTGTIVSNQSSEIIRMFNSALTGSGRGKGVITRPPCGAISTRLTNGSIPPSTTASTRLDLPPPRRPMRPPWRPCLTPWTGWTTCWASTDI